MCSFEGMKLFQFVNMAPDWMSKNAGAVIFMFFPSQAKEARVLIKLIPARIIRDFGEEGEN